MEERKKDGAEKNAEEKTERIGEKQKKEYKMEKRKMDDIQLGSIEVNLFNICVIETVNINRFKRFHKRELTRENVFQKSR